VIDICSLAFGSGFDLWSVCADDTFGLPNKMKVKTIFKKKQK